MRLLNTQTLQLEEFQGEDVPKYAILSHRWGKEEVLFKDMEQGVASSRAGFAKLESCCKMAHTRGFGYTWIDACCIDKSSSAELTESINSMFRWYARAGECYAYLADVPSTQLDDDEDESKEGNEFSSSVWFTRGW